MDDAYRNPSSAQNVNNVNNVQNVSNNNLHNSTSAQSSGAMHQSGTHDSHMSNLQHLQKSASQANLSNMDIHDPLESLSEKTRAWKHFVQGIINYFQEMQTMEDSVSKTYSKKELEPLKSIDHSLFRDASSIHTIDQALSRLPLTMSKQHENMSHDLGKLMKPLRVLEQEISNKRHELTAESKTRSSDSSKTAHNLTRHLDEFMRSLHEVSHKLTPTTQDPWITGHQLSHTIRTDSAAVSSHSARHQRDIASYKEFQRSIVTTIKMYLTDFVHAVDRHESLPVSSRRQLETMINSLDENSLEKELESELSDRPSNQLIQGLSRESSSASGKVLKTGPLSLKKMLGWSDKYAVLTSFGFLHLFDKEHDWNGIDYSDVSYTSIRLRRAMLSEIDERHPEEFEIVEHTEGGMMRSGISTYKLRTGDVPSSTEWTRIIGEISAQRFSDSGDLIQNNAGELEQRQGEYHRSGMNANHGQSTLRHDMNNLHLNKGHQDYDANARGLDRADGQHGNDSRDIGHGQQSQASVNAGMTDFRRQEYGLSGKDNLDQTAQQAHGSNSHHAVDSREDQRYDPTARTSSRSAEHGSTASGLNRSGQQGYDATDSVMGGTSREGYGTTQQSGDWENRENQNMNHLPVPPKSSDPLAKTTPQTGDLNLRRAMNNVNTGDAL